MRKICISLSKGGVAKSTSAVSIAHGLSQLRPEEDQRHGTDDKQHAQVKVRHEIPLVLEKMLVV